MRLEDERGQPLKYCNIAIALPGEVGAELCRGGRGPETNKKGHGGEYRPFGNLSVDTELIISSPCYAPKIL